MPLLHQGLPQRQSHITTTNNQHAHGTKAYPHRVRKGSGKRRGPAPAVLESSIASYRPCCYTKAPFTNIIISMKHLACWIVCFAGLVFPGSASMSDAIRTLRAVGPEGKGNAAAAAAWQQLSTADAKNLPAILAGMDEANDLAL